MTTKPRDLRVDRLCKLANRLDYQRFKHEVISNLKWFGIPTGWTLADIEKFYTGHKHKEKI